MVIIIYQNKPNNGVMDIELQKLNNTNWLWYKAMPRCALCQGPKTCLTQNIEELNFTKLTQI